MASGADMSGKPPKTPRPHRQKIIAKKPGNSHFNKVEGGIAWEPLQALLWCRDSAWWIEVRRLMVCTPAVITGGRRVSVQDRKCGSTVCAPYCTHTSPHGTLVVSLGKVNWFIARQLLQHAG